MTNFNQCSAKRDTQPRTISRKVKISLPPTAESLHSGFQVKIYNMGRLAGKRKSKQCNMKPDLCAGEGKEAVSFLYLDKSGLYMSFGLPPPLHLPLTQQIYTPSLPILVTLATKSFLSNIAPIHAASVDYSENYL